MTINLCCIDNCQSSKVSYICDECQLHYCVSHSSDVDNPSCLDVLDEKDDGLYHSPDCDHCRNCNLSLTDDTIYYDCNIINCKNKNKLQKPSVIISYLSNQIFTKLKFKETHDETEEGFKLIQEKLYKDDPMLLFYRILDGGKSIGYYIRHRGIFVVDLTEKYEEHHKAIKVHLLDNDKCCPYCQEEIKDIKINCIICPDCNANVHHICADKAFEALLKPLTCPKCRGISFGNHIMFIDLFVPMMKEQKLVSQSKKMESKKFRHLLEMEILWSIFSQTDTPYDPSEFFGVLILNKYQCVNPFFQKILYDKKRNFKVKHVSKEKIIIKSPRYAKSLKLGHDGKELSFDLS